MGLQTGVRSEFDLAPSLRLGCAADVKSSGLRACERSRSASDWSRLERIRAESKRFSTAEEADALELCAESEDERIDEEPDSCLSAVTAEGFREPVAARLRAEGASSSPEFSADLRFLSGIGERGFEGVTVLWDELELVCLSSCNSEDDAFLGLSLDLRSPL